MTYRVLTARKVREQLEGAPPELRGYVDGVVAFLRADPAAASVASVLLGGSEYKTIVFGEGRGFLDYQVFEKQRVVVLVDLVWVRPALTNHGGCAWIGPWTRWGT